MEKKKYPIGEEHYTLYEEIGTGVSASVYRALCNSLDEVVAIKILDFERDNCDLNNICREAQTMVLVDHPNVVKSHCSFVNGHSLWVVMPYMAGGSCLHILKAAYPDGFEEVVIATILRESLKGLEYLHSQGHIHRDIKAGNILIGSRGSIKLGDFGVSACLFDSGDRQRHRNTFVGTPCWMAPEVMEQVNGYDLKADIWSFGITALELAHGHAPFSKYPPLKVLLMTLQNAPPGLDYERDKKFSKSFRQMIASCLVKDPSKRPSAKKLLKHSFFKQARSSDYILRTLLEGLPDLGNRVQALKRKDEEMLAQKKIPDGEREEISQNEYKRGISSWNFDLEDLKAQASLVADEDICADKDQKGSSITVLDLLQQPLPSLSQLAQLQPEIPCSGIGCSDDNAADSAMATKITKSVKSDDDTSTPSLTYENHNELNVEIDSANKTELEENGKPLENLKTSILQSDVFSDKSESHSQSIFNKTEPERNGKPPENLKTSVLQSDKSESHPMDNGNVPSKNTDVPSEISSKASKTPAINSEHDEKAKCHVVQQRGRFKVTSENVDFERASPCPSLQKSHSMQVISQHPAISPPVTSVDPTPLFFNHSLYPMLETLLQTNISQREGILSIMRQVSTGETAVDCGGIPITATCINEKSLLEAAHDREKELLHEISELQWRLIRSQEELQKYKTEKANGGI